jgi:hypothetical protein
MSDYRHITKDPIIDIIRTEAQHDGDLNTAHLERIARNSGVSQGTLRKWFFGDTRKPQSITTRFVLEALGVKTRYFRADGTQIRQPRL